MRVMEVRMERLEKGEKGEKGRIGDDGCEMRWYERGHVLMYWETDRRNE
jgi:hypothetical protein